MGGTAGKQAPTAAASEEQAVESCVQAPEEEGVPGEPAEVDKAWSMISNTTGHWRLLGAEGTYSFDATSSVLMSDDRFVGRFCYQPLSTAGCFPELGGDARLPCIGITDSEIIAEISRASNQDAYFVLPSQLNGAEYMSHSRIVREINSYRGDHTGGPRGQLAVHPAAGQFILDNAACDHRPHGINAVDGILAPLHAAGFPFALVNGYLQVPALADGDCGEALRIVRESLHTLRPLVMEDVEASGVDPGVTALTGRTHRVNLVYASAVPVDVYLNPAKDAAHNAFMKSVAEMVLVAQYYGALKHAASRETLAAGKRLVYLMPLGGGVFNNSSDSIARAMSRAVELLSPEALDVLDIQLLTFRGNPRESWEQERLLRDAGKLKGHVVTLAPPPLPAEEEPAEDIAEAEAEIAKTLAAGSPPLACGKCGRVFGSSTMLQMHARRCAL